LLKDLIEIKSNSERKYFARKKI